MPGGQLHRENGARAELAAEPDLAPVLGDDSVAGAQSQATPAFLLPRGVEGIEGPLLIRGGHSATVVLDHRFHPLSGQTVANRHRAPGLAGVDGVVQQVQDGTFVQAELFPDISIGDAPPGTR